MPLIAGQDLTPLQYYKLLLEHVDYDTMRLSPGAGQPYEQLLVAVGETPEGQELVLQLTYLNDLVRAAASLSQVEIEEDEASTLQFFMKLPTLVPVARLPEAAYLMLVFNRLIPLGAFGVNASDGVFYAYTLIRENPDFDGRVVVEVVEKMALFAQELLRRLAALIAGQASLDQLEAALHTEYEAGER